MKYFYLHFPLASPLRSSARSSPAKQSCFASEAFLLKNILVCGMIAKWRNRRRESLFTPRSTRSESRSTSSQLLLTVFFVEVYDLQLAPGEKLFPRPHRRRLISKARVTSLTTRPRREAEDVALLRRSGSLNGVCLRWRNQITVFVFLCLFAPGFNGAQSSGAAFKWGMSLDTLLLAIRVTQNEYINRNLISFSLFIG